MITKKLAKVAKADRGVCGSGRLPAFFAIARCYEDFIWDSISKWRGF
ncbi:MAG: hypothetical protein LUI13_11145 [Lachnospiraceae bacterium]|nr:hypothetical protein [Lachnospiraceae bacterium]